MKCLASLESESRVRVRRRCMAARALAQASRYCWTIMVSRLVRARAFMSRTKAAESPPSLRSRADLNFWFLIFDFGLAAERPLTGRLTIVEAVGSEESTA